LQSNFEQSVLRAIGTGADALLELQDRDGFWREFDLKPGASEAWVTGWVGWCLRASRYRVDQRFHVRESCRRAIAALLAIKQPDGWGYSRRTGPDADTNAWVLRFLASCGLKVDALAYLKPYIDPGGGVHTFTEPGFGDWTNAHDDVAANVGLAFVEAGQKPREAAAIAARLAQRFPPETYWWSTPEYGAAWTLRCLTSFGGIPPSVRASAHDWIAHRPAPATAFETAHRLIALQSLNASQASCLGLANALVELAGPAGWAGGVYLLVPPTSHGPPQEPNAELRAVLTNALCMRALSEWLVRSTAPVRTVH
jgi:hypothetical protein